MSAAINPYPPLLNPKTIDYKHIGAEMAWELNLPLPSNYKFVWVSNGGSGSEATLLFFNHCGVHLELNHSYIEKEKYVRDFDMLMQNPLRYHAICIHPRLIGMKYISLLQKTDFLYTTGDIISKLKVGLNHLADDASTQIQDKHRNLTLNTSLNHVLPTLKYAYPNSDGKPDVAQLNSDIIQVYTGFHALLCCTSPYIRNLYVLSTEDISIHNAFNTFTKLCNVFALPTLPHDRKLFTQRVNTFRGGLAAMPLNFHVSLPHRTNKAIIHIMPYRLSLSYINDNMIDITQHFFSSTISIDGMDIIFLMNGQDFAELSQYEDILDQIKRYLVGYMDILQQSVDETKAYLVNEVDIVRYLKNNKDIRLRLIEHLKDEMLYFKTFTPDIVSSWKYYQEFERICVEEGDMQE